MGARRTICILGGIALVLTGVIATESRREDRANRRYFDESTRFRELGELAGKMITENAEGVTFANNSYFIQSFDAFYRYVAKNRPDLAANGNQKNPFPALLPEPSYDHLIGAATNPDTIIFWSCTIHHKNVGQVQMRLRASGVVDSLKMDPARGE